METKEREEILSNINTILDRVEVITKERETLIEQLKSIFPTKEGDKVSIVFNLIDAESKHVRFAFVNKIEIKLIGNERKAKIIFDLQKCKADGSVSQYSDYLKHNEFVTKIKS